MLELYVDGACSGNPGPGGWGAVIIKDGKLISTHQGRCEETTNNRMEMMAILWVLENFGSLEDVIINDCIPIVYSDSAYCVNSFTNWIYEWKANGWTRAKGKKLENLDLIKKYYELISRGYKIDLRKIAGHAGHRWNEMADDLATGRIK